MPTICFENIANGLGALLPAETRSLSAFSKTFLERYRRTLLDKSTTSSVPAARARTVLWLACSTELKTVFTDLIAIPAATLQVSLCSRRRVNDIDNDIVVLLNDLTQALGELGDLGLPTSYLEAISTRATSESAQHRVSAACTVVMLAAAILIGR